MEEVANSAIGLVRDVSDRHGPMAALLFFVLALTFVLAFALGYFVGTPAIRELANNTEAVSNNSAAVTAMQRIVAQVTTACLHSAVRAPQSWQPMQPQQPGQPMWTPPPRQPNPYPESNRGQYREQAE